MKKLLKGTAMAAFLTIALAGSQLWAQVSGNPVDVTINVDVPSVLWVYLSSDTINFEPSAPVPTGDPPTWPEVEANENPVTVWTLAFVASDSTVTLEVLANGDLVSGSNTIPISNITWTASGSGYEDGTMNNSNPQTAGSWTGFGFRSGQFNYFYTNNPQAPGLYTATVTYTLSAT